MTPYPPVPKWPSDLARKRNNQAIIAAPLCWPDGALAACAELEDRHPGWHVSWLIECTSPGFERPAGFYAQYSEIHTVELYAATAEELEPRMEVPEHFFYPKVCGYCVDEAEGRLRRARLPG